MTMTSSVPYLLRAIKEWIVDKGCKPFLIIDADKEDTSVPREYVKDGQIVLNISMNAIRDFIVTDEHVMFSGRFGGVPHEIYARIDAVIGIVAKENGEGMWFPKEETDSEPPPERQPKKGPPSLKVIK
jgi:stringent starvation protein B